MSIIQHKQPPLIKICGQTHQDAVDTSMSNGSNLLGFIFHPKSPRSITAARAAKINSGLSKRVGVFVNQSADEIISIMIEARLDYAQLHGEQSLADAQHIGAARVIRVLWPERNEDMDSLQSEINRWGDHCAYFLLDAGHQGGGHGRSLSDLPLEQLSFPRPWILAGGLHAGNIPELMQRYKPNGIDINSGIEAAPGIKLKDKMRHAIHAAYAHR